MVVLIHNVAEYFELLPVVSHETMSAAMCKRGMVTHRIFGKLVDALETGEENQPPSGVGTHEDVDTDEVAGTAPPEKIRTTSPGRVEEPSGNDSRSQVSWYDVFEFRRGFAGRARATEGEDNYPRDRDKGSSDYESAGQNILRRRRVPSAQGREPSGRGSGEIIV